MATCVPVRELKDTAHFLSIVEDSREPVTVTRNGREAIIVMTPEMYGSLRSELAHERLMRKLDRAETELSRGEGVDGPSFMAAMRVKYGE